MKRPHLPPRRSGRRRPAAHLARTAALAACAVLLASCGSGAASSDDGPPSLSAATTALRESLVGSSAVRYDPSAVSGTTLDGKQVVATDLDGPVVYWFWAPWCTVCRAEAPAVSEVAEDLAGEVTFVGVASRGPQEDMEAFVAETGTTGIAHIADLDGTIWAQFGVSAQPAFVFVDREGSATGWLGGLGEPLLNEVATSLAG